MTEEKKLEHYEMLYIIPNKFTDEEAIKVGDKVKTIITDNGGVITLFANWGKKKLAYQIKKFNHGYYQLVEFDVAPMNLAKINKVLRMASDVLRHQIIKKEIKTEEELARDKKIAEKIAAKSMEKKELDEKIEEKKIEDKKKKKMDLKDLDEKLDKILDTDDLI
ncbi:MAG: 30S ribosomal protein S6 [Patescibacteria group bacterium]|nr:30S ribosomal protein S6 [Patescibacteria group bacterium]MDD4610741.1 30S ribosomal protein S6 [Patescibacteria group bacterium]